MSILLKNQIHTVTIEGYTSEALGVCRIDGQAVFVPGALPGERWEIKLVKLSASANYARAEKLLQASPFRETPRCPHYGKCGGCACWHMSYEEELRFKLHKVNDAFARIGKLGLTATEILGADPICGYRNKGILAISDSGGRIRGGFYRQRSHDLIPAEDCLIQNALCEKAARCLTAFMEQNGIRPYDENTGKGTVRHLFCRKAYHSDDAMVCIVAARGFGGQTQSLVDALRAACPELSGIVLNINRSQGNTVLSGDFYTLWGKSEIRDSLCGLWFDIAPQAFYQINPPQAETLYQKALSYAQVGQDDLVFDLYCGAGTISLCLARQAGRVIGAEIVPQAIENAKKNAAANGIANAEFLCGDAGEAAEALARRGLHPRVVVVDPPRKGMSEQAIAAVASMQPERIVYVSCNCATLARDLQHFSQLGYQAEKACAVDMFPRTSHVETVVLMSRVSK